MRTNTRMKAGGGAALATAALLAAGATALHAQQQPWDGDDYLVSSFSGGTVAVYDHDFVFKGYLDPAMPQASGLGFTPDGGVVSAGFAQEARVWSFDGTLVSTIISPDLGLAADVDTDSLGNFYVGTQVEALGMRKFDQAGNSVSSLGADRCAGSTVLPGDLAWAGSFATTIEVFDLGSGATLPAIPLDNGQKSAVSMHYSPSTSTVLSVDWSRGDIYEREAADGTFVRAFHQDGAQIISAIRGPVGDVVGVAFWNNSVVHFAADGTFVSETPLPDVDNPFAISWAGNSAFDVGLIGSASGLDVERLVCRNLDTGKVGSMFTSSNRWNCDDIVDFKVEPGERVSMRVRGPANGLVTLRGSDFGITTQRINCRNITTGQRVTQVTGATAWNCEDLGLTVAAGDLVEVEMRGPRL